MERLTIVIDILDKEKAAWIFKDEAKQKELGIWVRALSNGNALDRVDLYKEKAEILNELESYMSEDVSNKLEKIDIAIEKSWERNIT